MGGYGAYTDANLPEAQKKQKQKDTEEIENELREYANSLAPKKASSGPGYLMGVIPIGPPGASGAVEGVAAEGTVSAAGSWVRVGRWMSQEELTNMQTTGMVQESTGGGGGSWVASPASPTAYNAAKPGSLYVEYDVPANSVKPAGSGWGRIPGPNSVEGRLAATKGEAPPQLRARLSSPSSVVRNTSTSARSAQARCRASNGLKPRS